MAKRPSVKEILEMARRGGPAVPAGGDAPAEASEPDVPEAVASDEAVLAAPVLETAAAESIAPLPAADVPTPSALGRPLTLKEKLAAARAGGAPQPAAAPKATKAPQPAAPAAAPETAEEAPSAEPRAEPAAPAKPLGRPMTLQEKLAAARGGGAQPAAAAAGAAKPAAAKTAAPAAKAAAGRVLPPLEKITDPHDLAEAARQAAAKKAKELAAKAAESAPPKSPPKPAPAKPTSAPPKPTRELAAATVAAPAGNLSRRGFYVGAVFIGWLLVAWCSFTAALVAMTLMSVRFMFPNVLAEPPSTIKVGLPSNYEPEEVSERFKAEWGFWIVRSTRYNGQEILYALQSVCTHLGCPPNWLAAEQKFKCPCHGSGFYISGVNFEGPAPRPLERFKVALADDGQVMVDKSQKFQEELGQWADPDSFIPV
jgi:cytochrome b6-f complex iron-sulfur subunit